MADKTGILLVNLGTPDSPSTRDVRRFLREFLMDEFIIDIPWYKRWPLVNLIIAPFRAPMSSGLYAALWETSGSPLLFHSISIRDKLQSALGDEFVVALGMRYGKPGIAAALNELTKKKVSAIIILPLFPQYAPATTGSVIHRIKKLYSHRNDIPEIRFIEHFFDHPDYVAAMALTGRQELESHHYDHVLFSFHGVPERQIIKNAPGPSCDLSSGCCDTLHDGNKKCYRAQCYATARLLVKTMSIPADRYTVTFQSRLGRGAWLRPYTIETARRLPEEGKKNVLVFSPSFITDCLETTIELGAENKEVFMTAGGSTWTVVKSLNSSDMLITALGSLVKKHTPV